VTSDTTPPLGLYSIGIRDLDVTALLTLAAGHQVPFLHLRGGPKGYDLARRDQAQLAAWARQAHDGVPVTMVTADLDLADFLQPAAPEYRRASADLERLAEATRALGANAVRLLARRPPLGTEWDALVIPDLPAGHGWPRSSSFTTRPGSPPVPFLSCATCSTAPQPPACCWTARSFTLPSPAALACSRQPA
jgi:hypothetical protein